MMKKIISIFALIFMVLTLGSCGSKSADFNSIKENMMSADDSLPSMKTVSDKSENAETRSRRDGLRPSR